MTMNISPVMSAEFSDTTVATFMPFFPSPAPPAAYEHEEPGGEVFVDLGPDLFGFQLSGPEDRVSHVSVPDGQPLTVSTGHVAARTTCCVVEPNNVSPTPSRPWAPMTMRSASCAMAVSRIWR